MTLRFLATGHSFNDLEADFKIHRTAICGIAIEVCNAIYDCLKDEYLEIQQTKETGNVLLRRLKKRGSFLTASEQRTGNTYPFYTLKILSQIFTIINVSSAL